ncbi:hypothetical protein [Seohaeicola zhoushanensis]|uniref:Uncharacterized protein n=1 Tax=Seohaeicola zhoushanensis TaxID=1569283 RepID=A0A8J3GU20_9RHOB|nr:hypothetical protein [Seohaeicola zhoushanensis]GHF33801.1 hypothetical protein GCM10017056_01530 [Seohaeicola zhoushanensis]
MILDVFIVLAVLATGGLLLWPRLSVLRLWRAAITPLASIIGSGFLVLGPILDASYGWQAPLVMAALCLGAWAFGAAIRANIAHRAAREEATPTEVALENAASWVLSFAYVISVAYYLNLFGAFGVRLTPFDSPLNARLLTTAAYAVILAVGWTRGFGALERMEQVSVGLKLAIIAGLLVGLCGYFVTTAEHGALIVKPPQLGGWAAVTLAFGLIVTVQGFETSRYLGRTYAPEMRIRSMKLAQIVASAIYMVYIVLLTYTVDTAGTELTETAIISMMEVVAPVLPLLLVVAALSAQFSAAVADTGGAGGLVNELTHGRLTARQSYAVLVGLGLALTWSLNVFEIISYASRGFALYYAVQSAIAVVGASGPRRAGFAALAVLGVAITVFGVPVE